MIELVNDVEDLKRLNVHELPLLCEDIRKLIIKRVETIGGHLASNLGVVEISVALHYVFDSPKDKFVFDTSHQTYTHKILTGRKKFFEIQEKYGDISGFSTPNESIHDQFKMGHTSSSISLALGLAKGRDVKKSDENIVAIIGDGALSGGQSYEALNFAGDYKGNLIIVLNDNEMSIAENHGGLYKNLKELRDSKGQCENNYFKSLGLSYEYLEEGNDVISLVKLFEKHKNVDRPVLLHVHTQKGRGSEEAVKNKEKYHLCVLEKKDSKALKEPKVYIKELFKEITKVDDKVVGIYAATPEVFLFDKEFREEMGEKCIDTGICEQFEMSFASGIAKNGCKPIVFVSASFIQRAYDQLNHEISMNNLPVIVLIYNGFIRGGDCTHIGMFDTGLIGNLPNVKAYAPVSKEELKIAILSNLLGHKGPVFIRIPKFFDEPKEVKNKGAKVHILAVGHMFKLANDVCLELNKRDIKTDLKSIIRYNNVEDKVRNLELNADDLIVTIEDAVIDGGYGEKVARVLGENGIKVLCFGGQKAFNDLKSDSLVSELNGLNVENIVTKIIKNFKNR